MNTVPELWTSKIIHIARSINVGAFDLVVTAQRGLNSALPPKQIPVIFKRRASTKMEITPKIGANNKIEIKI
jgi:hypothetical protein